MFHLVLVVIFLWTLSPQAAPGSAGVISVKVFDQNGRPLKGAQVRMDEHPKSMMRVIPECTTDESGTCSRNDFQMGTYSITAMKPADGYPNISYEFYGRNRKVLVVELTPQHPRADVVLTLGPKAAMVTIHPIDHTTGSPVANFTMILWNAEKPHELLGIGKTPDSVILVPPEEDVELQVQADGYQPWILSNHPEVGGRRALHLHSGQKKEVTIRLKRSPS